VSDLWRLHTEARLHAVVPYLRLEVGPVSNPQLAGTSDIGNLEAALHDILYVGPQAGPAGVSIHPGTCWCDGCPASVAPDDLLGLCDDHIEELRHR
jgi:hypothetical protein